MRNMAVFDTLLTIQMMDWVPALRVPQTVLVGAPGEVEVTRAKESGGDGGGIDTAWFMLKQGMRCAGRVLVITIGSKEHVSWGKQQGLAQCIARRPV